MATQLIGDNLKRIEKYHGGSLNPWVGGPMNITAQTYYDLKYLTICLSRYINSRTEPSFLSLRNGMNYIMYNQHKLIIYPRKNIFKTN